MPIASAYANLSAAQRSYQRTPLIRALHKPKRRENAFVRTGLATLAVKAGVGVKIGGNEYIYHDQTPILMPALAAGDDIAIWIRPNGQPQATKDFINPPEPGSLGPFGGAHFAPGGNAPGFNSGGDTTPQFNPFSIWDVRFCPKCPDPRGMTFVEYFWSDIYILNQNHIVNGTSRYNQPVADGSNPPRIPIENGGTGANNYANMTWHVSAEVMASHGKQLISEEEFVIAAWGTREAQSGGSDPDNTILRNAYTSYYGLINSSGNHWLWGRNQGGPAAGASWANTNGGRGNVFNQPNAARLGGGWAEAASSGSRASRWYTAPSGSGDRIGARGRSDHLCHD